MAAIYNQVLMHWTDANNRPATTFWTTQDQGSGGAGAYIGLAAAAQAMSYAALDAIQLQTTLVIASSAASGPYQSVLDRAVLLSAFVGRSGSTNLSIPAPISGIFLPGEELVDMSNASVAAFLSEAQATLGDGNGHAINYFKRGTRQRAKGNP